MQQAARSTHSKPASYHSIWHVVLADRIAVRAVYLNGQILGASGFPGGNQGLHCEWALITESNWQKVQGLDKASAQSCPRAPLRDNPRRS